jgi:hypothetical protein
MICNDKNVTIFSMIDGERTSKVYDSDEVRAGTAADPTLRSIIVVDNNTGKVALNTAMKTIPGVASMGAAVVTHIPSTSSWKP